MNHYWIFRVLGGVLLLVGIAAVGFFAYQAGAAQGALTVPGATVAVPVYGPPHEGFAHAFFLLPFLICLAPFFLCLFIFLPLRMMFGPRHMRGHFGHWHHCHAEGDPAQDDFVPPPFAEWHRRAHEKKQ
jgi:hypothetical protein